MKYKLTITNLLCGRWLLSMLTLLMMPVVMQAEDYGLTVAGIAVTDQNASNITGESITAGSVSFSNNTLTLDNATINGDIVSDLNSNLTVHLIGRNVINIDQHAFLMMGSNKLKFTGAEGALLFTDATSDEAFAYSEAKGKYIEFGYYDLPADYKVSYDAELKRSIGKYYGFGVYAFIYDASYLGPQYVTSANCDRLAGYYNETTNTWDNSTITLSYDDSKKMVTLNNMNLESAFDCYLFRIDESNAKNLKINLLGNNKLRQFDGEYGMGFVTSDFHDETITITTDPENPGTLTMVDLPGDYYESTIMQAVVSYQNGLGYVKDENNVRYIKTVSTIPSLGLTVAGVTVNENNAGNVLGEVNEETEEPTVVFDAEHNTLTLNNAYVYVESESAIVSGLENLTVFLVGENYITCYGDKLFDKTSAVDEATITFTTDEASNGSLSFMCGEDNIFGEGVTPAYNNVSLKDNGDTKTIDSRLGISVGGIPVTLFNTDDVFGDGTVSYDAKNHTLTLNGATIESDEERAGIEYTNDEDLTIALIGNNSVHGLYGCAAIQKLYGVETPNLSFARGDANQHFSLTLIAESEDDLIYGFDTNYGEDFFVFDDVDDGTYTTTISTSVFGGTGSEDEPFLIKTPEDLKRFANYYNEGCFARNVHVKLNNDINCENLKDFTTIANSSDATFMGVFDGNNKEICNLTISGTGLFGYVEQDGDYVGTIKDLTLSGLQVNGASGETVIGGIVAYLYAGAVVSNCTVVNSTIACESDTYNPYVGAIAAQMDGATVTGCVVDNVKVKAETNYNYGSGPAGYAGGIVANAYEGTISSCIVRNGTKITNYYADEYASLYAGAIVGQAYKTNLSENYYYYDVTVELLNGTVTANKIIKSEYEQRGNGGKVWNEETQQYENLPDVFEDNGAVMYTQKLTLPEETEEASVVAEEDTYYAWAESEDGVLVAPGQTMRLNTFPGDGYVITSLTVTNTATSTEISTSSEDFGDNITQYMFTMPDAPVTVTLTTQEKMGIRVAGVEITEANAGDVLGDGKVSYDVESNTLTLNGATVNGCIYNYNESKPNLTVYLLGENVIDGGYVSDDENGDWAFGTSVANARLYITTDEENPGQLLIKNVYRNKWGNPEYYEGCYPAKKNGLTESQNYNDMKALIATAPVVTPGEGLYWPDQQYEVSTLMDGPVYYCDGMSHFGETAYEAPFTMSAVGKYNLSVWEEVTVDETDFSLYANGSMYIVHNKPEFSLEEGTYYDAQTVKIENLPSLPENPNYYPQVWYYIDDNKTDSVRYDAIKGIPLTESAKVCVYILDEDSGKVLKSAPVEAEYTIKAKTQLNISYAQNSREWASYCADENLETPDGLQAYVVTNATAEGVSVTAIGFIPEGVGVLLKRTKDIEEPIKAKVYLEEPTETPDNLLKGTTNGTAVGSEEGNVYVLYNDGFTRATKGTIPAHRAYLVLGAEVPAAEGRLSIFEDETTALKLVNSEKRIVNSEVYDLQGRKVNHSSLFTSGKATLKKGLYIVNGKKQVIK